MDCTFCKISAGEIPSQKVYEDNRMMVFKDIQPQAPVHLLAVPKTHIESVEEITPENSMVVAHIFTVIARISKEQGLGEGYRVVTNCGEHGQQTVPHLHFHIIGGRQLSWPPG